MITLYGMSEANPKTRPAPLLECIPNLSEGRNLKALDQLWQALNSIENLQCLHRTSDWDHHRSVLTLAGPPESIRQASHQLFAWAHEHIDLRNHQGIHPRIGAVDVFPLVVLQGISETEAIEFSHQLGAELAHQWHVPIYLYEQSSLQKHRSALPLIRKGGFEQLNFKMQQSEWQPDFGPDQAHISMGATVLGVRKILIAWNVFLKSNDLQLAQNIARKIRASNGGLSGVRALGLYLKAHNQVQISMNLLDYHQTSLFQIMQAIRQELAVTNTEIDHTEFIGLPPQNALLNCAMEYLQTASDFSLEHVLERKVQF